MNKVSLYQNVRLITDRYVEDGLKIGMTGIVLEKYDDEHFEIEWFNDSGNSVALFAFSINDFEVIE